MSNHKRNDSLRDEIGQTRTGEGQNGSAAGKKPEKAKTKHRRQISGSISKSDWTQKIFVLVTSGYLLQYSGEGSFDRLPEKMMQLGKDSVAFASDAIPGKHWVLQVSQAMDSDGVPAADSRSLLSRLAFRGADYRRSCTSLLLVLNSAEDMDLWIAVVRREIEALGGKKGVSETGKPKFDEKVMQLRAQPSHRYLVQKDPDQFSNPATPLTPTFGTTPWAKENETQLQQELEDAAHVSSNPQDASSIRPSTGHRSITPSIKSSAMSHDEMQLDNLRDSTHRFSYVSSGQRTVVTSQFSSPATSPTRDSHPTFDDFSVKNPSEDIRPRPNAAAINERRRSMQSIRIPTLDAQHTPKTYRHSTYGVPTKSSRTQTATVPNFSIPNSSTKRSLVKDSPVKELPPIPTIVMTSPTRTQGGSKIPRKGPPPALNLTRPRSFIKDITSPKRTPNDTPTQSSFKVLAQVMPSMIDIPPRSPGPITPSPRASTHPRPDEEPSLEPLNSPETGPLDFEFPRRVSSMQLLGDFTEELFEPPLRPAPLPPAALTAPLPSSPSPPPGNTENGSMRPKSIIECPALANTKTKIRRPISMQIQPSHKEALGGIIFHTSTTRPSSSLSHSNQIPNSSRPFSQASSRSSHSPPVTLISPAMQRARNAKALTNRSSMPLLVSGPPPAPPPDCALPPLPVGGR